MAIIGNNVVLGAGDVAVESLQKGDNGRIVFSELIGVLNGECSHFAREKDPDGAPPISLVFDLRGGLVVYEALGNILARLQACEDHKNKLAQVPR